MAPSESVYTDLPAGHLGGIQLRKHGWPFRRREPSGKEAEPDKRPSIVLRSSDIDAVLETDRHPRRRVWRQREPPESLTDVANERVGKSGRMETVIRVKRRRVPDCG